MNIYGSFQNIQLHLENFSVKYYFYKEHRSKEYM